MKTLLKTFLPLLVMVFIISGCAGKTTVKEWISDKVSPAEENDISGDAADLEAEELTEEYFAEEQLGEEGLTSGAEEGTAVASMPGKPGITGRVGKFGKFSKDGKTFAAVMPTKELSEKAVDEGRLFTIHFDFDRYTIRAEDRDLLAKNAEWLMRNPAVQVKIEGHADERGSTEYNIALGEKRAWSVKKFLKDLGVGPNRLSTITYGEEKPVDTSHNEDAWSKNRRAEFEITALR